VKIYTKTGDTGETSIYGGNRLSKDDIRVEAYGTVDELNSWIGALRAEISHDKSEQLLVRIQNELFVVGSLLASTADKHADLPQISADIESSLETAIDQMQAQLEPLKTFILPSGNKLISKIHIARTVCRRAERRVVSFSNSGADVKSIIRLLNRLSDFLFVLARFQAKTDGIADVPWNP